MKNLLGLVISLTMIAFLPAVGNAAGKVELTIKKTQQSGDEYCIYMVIRNNKLDKVSLNVFGSQVLKDENGAEASFNIMNMQNPALDPNAEILEGEVVSGWSCWTVPSADYKPDTLSLKSFLGTRYAKVKIKSAANGSSSKRKQTPTESKSANPPTGQQGITEKLDEILKRLDRIEKRLKP